MAFNNQEIELKLSITKKRFERIAKKLNEIAKFVKFSHQVDDYYTPVNKSFLEPKYPFEWLSVRERDGVVKLNYKHWYPENTKYTTHCDEYETEIEDKNQLQMLLQSLNYKKFISVEKKRNTFLYENSLEIALDEVKNLGFFVEVETIKDFGSVEKARSEILNFTKSLGLRGTKTVPGGYAAVMMRKRGLVK